MSNLYLLLAVLIGVAFACQPAINAVASKMLGSPHPATVLSVAITLAASCAIMIGTQTVPPVGSVKALPVWILFGGFIGVLVVAGGAAIVPVTGVAVFFVCLIAGQILGSVILDQIGAFGLPVREISPLRALGVVLTFGGVLLVRFGS